MRIGDRFQPSAPPTYLSTPDQRRRVLSVSVDLDPLSCYYRIHGLGQPPPELVDVILAKGLPRFLELFEKYAVRATFFVVGSDTEREANQQLLRDAFTKGHELSNHSYSHPYDLARLPREVMRREVQACHDALRSLTGGRAAKGFRSPGYDMSPELLNVLQEVGYSYDSSILPSPTYYAAKLLMLGRLALTGSTSASVLTGPAALLAPLMPYRPDPLRPHRRGQATLVELPIAVTPGLRLPAIGTSLLLSDRLRVYLLEQMRRCPFFNLELHGIDLIDAAKDGIPVELVKRQPDLRVPLRDKQRSLSATLDRLAAEYQIVPLREAAEEVHRVGHLSRPLD